MQTIRIKQPITREGRFIRQTGSRGRFAVLRVRFEPTQSRDPEVVWQVPEGLVPADCADAAISTISELFSPGGAYGDSTLVFTRITFLDGEYHATDSNPVDYKSATAIALREAIRAEGEFSAA
jgi:elongation factor G